MSTIINVGVSFFCRDNLGRLLISQRSQNARDEKNRWDCGAGAVRFGENIEDAVYREVSEEYCCHLKSIWFLGYRNVFRVQNNEQTHWIMFDFAALINKSEVAIGEPAKCQKLRWITLSELETMDEAELHSQLPGAVKKYHDQLSQLMN